MCLNLAAHPQVSLSMVLGTEQWGLGVGLPGEARSSLCPDVVWCHVAQHSPRRQRKRDASQPRPFHLLSPADPTDAGNFSFKNMLDARVEGEVDVPKTVKVTGTAGLSRSSTLEVQTLSVAPKALETLHQER